MYEFPTLSNINESLLSVRGLLIFEVASRTKSFTVAAKELNITQPAVSRGVRELEKLIGVQLFFRSPKGNALTPAGITLSSQLNLGFKEIRSGLTEITNHQGGKRRLTILTSTDTAAYYIIPLLPEIQLAFPDIKVAVTSRPHPELDIHSGDFDLMFALSVDPEEKLGKFTKWFIAKKQYYPVCSADYFHRYGPFNTPEEIAQHPIITTIDSGGPIENNYDFYDWFDFYKIDVDWNSVTVYNDYFHAIQAAINGDGIIAGYPVIHGLLEQQLLVPAIKLPYNGPLDFYIITPDRVEEDQTVIAFVEWLQSTSVDKAANFYID